MIAFVMSGGSNRGALAAGALLGLMEAGIQPDILVGASAGAINAAALAVNPTVEGARRLAQLWSHARKEDFFPGSQIAMLLRLASGRSLFPSDGLRRFAAEVLGERCFGDLRDIRLYIPAANLNTGTLYLYGDQPGARILDAVIASAAHPLAFPPVKVDQWQLVDGGVVANVPVGIALDKGATEIYILNVGYSGDLVENQHKMVSVLNRSISIMMYQHFLMDLSHATERSDLVLHTISWRDFRGIPMWDLSHSAEMVAAGQKAVQEYLHPPRGVPVPPPDIYEPLGEEPPPPPGAEIYVPAWLSPSDLLDLPPRERQITTHLVRHGPADAATLAQALGQDPAEVAALLAALAQKGQLCLSAGGEASVTLGRRKRKHLPSQIWDSVAPEGECETK